MYAVRAPHSFDGTRFLPGGATVLVEDEWIVGVEPFGCGLPEGCAVSTYDGTLLPGLVDTHTHLVTDSGPFALDRVAGYTDAELHDVVTEALRRQLAAGVTTVRDLGDRRFAVVDRRDRHPGIGPVQPRIVAAGPPITSVGGHCHYLGGEVAGEAEIRAAVRHRAERRVDVVKVMASGGAMTPGTDVLHTQFTDEELRLLVGEAHAAGLPVTAHAHGTPAVRQAVAAGVDGIEHCSCITDRGIGQADDALLETIAASGVAVCPTLGMVPALMREPTPEVRAVAERLHTTPERMLADRLHLASRLRGAGVRIVSGVDSGIGPAKAHGTLAYAVAELLAAGYSTAEAVATATSGAADACGLGGTTGRLAPGHDADLVVVDGDLSSDITALARPVSVWVRGVDVGPQPPPGSP